MEHFGVLQVPSSRLPLETIQPTIAEPWSEATTADAQCILYSSLSAAHPLMHELLVTVAVRNVSFKLAPLTTRAPRRDIDLHRVISDQVVSFARARDGPQDDPLRDAGILLQHVYVHIRLEITPILDVRTKSRATTHVYTIMPPRLCGSQFPPICRAYSGVPSIPLLHAGSAPVGHFSSHIRTFATSTLNNPLF
ncbi:hypothetical protein K466DRAFT_599220 [Polyporus arcularius HHB13444]|uniref:Uncharacterized protein n=1 Tax=Polyporus arcularius HHB13444 TaxID=1314778 RepID=A0A5C3PET5_9APHY|nr:hypothetical protein K466DRAFT_599220 [Polyporus arcularius HHB13444]